MQTSLFPSYADARFQIFLNTELGQLYRAIPFADLSLPYLAHKDRHPQGSKPIFSIEGGLGLMFLKHYLCLSDAKLIARVNTDWQLQMFCRVNIPAAAPVKDDDMVGRWRRFFAQHGDWEELQGVLGSYWEPNLAHTHVLMDDATVFESYIKFPTDVKLLWDCTRWAWSQVVHLCREAGLPAVRWNFRRQQNRQLSYSKRRRKAHRLGRKRRRELLRALWHVLEKLQGVLDRGAPVTGLVDKRFFARLKTVRAVCAQQQYHYDNPGRSVPQRIVSLYKPYLRPIVRGKENRRCEFGAKVHISQVDGINFIEHLSFEAFHEGRRLWRSVYKHRRRFGSLKQYAADQVYASNANRKHLKKLGVATCFKKKGRDKKGTAQQASQVRSILGKARATVLEGSFGNEKNHYLLGKVRARTKATEIIWIFFGIHTANAIRIGRRIHASAKQARAA